MKHQKEVGKLREQVEVEKEELEKKIDSLKSSGKNSVGRVMRKLEALEQSFLD